MIRFASLLCSLMALVGCTFSPDQCFEDSDCPEQQTCVLKADVLLCVAPFEPMPDGGSPDVGVIPDMSMSEPDASPSIPCDATCSRDGFEPNDEVESATGLVANRYGCRRNVLSDFELRQDASLCAEEVDWFEIPVSPCEDKSYLLNVEIRPTSACGPDLWDVRGDVWSCDSPTVSCSSNENGRRFQFLISDSLPQDFKLRLAVRSAGAEFDYVIRVSTQN